MSCPPSQRRRPWCTRARYETGSVFLVFAKRPKPRDCGRLRNHMKRLREEAPLRQTAIRTTVWRAGCSRGAARCTGSSATVAQRFCRAQAAQEHERHDAQRCALEDGEGELGQRHGTELFSRLDPAECSQCEHRAPRERQRADEQDQEECVDLRERSRRRRGFGCLGGGRAARTVSLRGATNHEYRTLMNSASALPMRATGKVRRRADCDAMKFVACRARAPGTTLDASERELRCNRSPTVKADDVSQNGEREKAHAGSIGGP